MTAAEFKIVTPRGTIGVHTVFDNAEEAKAAGWGLWFTHFDAVGDDYDIYARANMCGAVVKRQKLVKR